MITSPYNFVPLSDKVVMPFWAKHVSHDIPFKDAQSGVLKLTIRAESPIYVRNGVPRNVNKDAEEAKVFNNINNQFFIPGSSIKGMLRSVMEIMSFGRMGNKVNDHKYSVRDFQNDTIYPKSDLSKEVLCGFLYKKDGQFFLDNCDKPGRISQKTLDSLCIGIPKMSEFYKSAQNITKDTKSAKAKYEAFPFRKDNYKFSLDFIDVERPIFKFDQDGKPGTIVFSGQPGVRKEPEHEKASGKHLEFIFFEPEFKEAPVAEEAIKNFFFAYYDHDRTQQKDDWKWRKTQLDRGEKIPVFFRIDNDGSIKDMGLSMLYKITYQNSIQDAINCQQKNAHSFDLAETIFGYAEDKDALKGRVHVGHAFAIDNPIAIMEVNAVLAGPKASYYPNYVEQNNKNGENERINGEYKTFKDKAVVRGWKRYPIHSGDVKKNLPPEIKGKVNDKIGTKFIPLPSGTEFTLEINYHNLRKEELGALISAITFHNTDGLFHSIGSGKPLGYGKSSITIINLEEDKKIEMLKAFELFMDAELGNSSPLWFQCGEIKELFAMAKPAPDDSKLEYMELDNFVKAKGRRRNDPKFALQKYSFISQNNVDVKPLASEDELKKAIQNYKKDKELFETQHDITTLKNNLISKNAQELEATLNIKKRELIVKLRERREMMLVQEIDEREAIKTKEFEKSRESRKTIAQQRGLILDGFNITDRKAFDNLGKLIIIYAKDLHLKSENQLKTDIADGELIQRKDYDGVTKIIKEIFAALKSKKDKEKWLEMPIEKNHFFLKFKFWLGQPRALSLYDDLNKS